MLDSTSTTSFGSPKKEIFFLMIPEGDRGDENGEDQFFGNKVEKHDQVPSLIQT